MIAHLALPRILRIGGGAVREIGDVIASLGLTRPLVVTDSFVVGTGAAERMIKDLTAAGLLPSLFAETVADPTTDSLATGLLAIREHGSDSVIGFGGGSPMDTAKALGLLGRQGGPMSGYKAPRANAGPALPVIAVPTTAGSGPEATLFTLISDSAGGEKMLCIGPAFLPVAAVIDYELTVSMPPRLTADTGVDALTHAIEAYVSTKANPFSDSLALVAIGTIGRVLRRAYADSDDLEAREQMMLAATTAGMAFSNSSVALVHGMSRPIGAHFAVAHGLSNTLLLPDVTASSVRAAAARYADCARALGVATGLDDNATAAGNLVSALAELCRDLRVPRPAAYGIDRDRWHELIPVMAEQALASGFTPNNPRVPADAEIRDLYEQIYS
ncbi:iron-containing alcohol dehydrogenase [Nocardia xishanensis]|uniref:iron-containing alcohol dehydrogenase n=1 Tax=Nocardia xishanensis TaxID=238964 RepID=UPI00082DDBA2|nr:iron-containing alcohol dehydrogenase [Nocardia xishanensis]